jgi:phosphatidylinositol kinase/protein kinase (PI-3  family)
MAVLEAFVYDPLINWKLQLQPSPIAPNEAIVDSSQQGAMASVTDGIGNCVYVLPQLIF